MTTITAKVEIEFVPLSGTYVDISSRVESVEIDRPRATRTDGASATTCTIQLQNNPDASGFCPFTPDSPPSAYYPNVERDRRVRVTALWSASSSVRFLGWTDAWTPDMSDGDVSQATCVLTASCVLSRYDRKELLSEWGMVMGEPGRVGTCDYWPYDGITDSLILRAISSQSTQQLAAQVITPQAGQGSLSFSSPSDTVLLDGGADFSRGDSQSPSPVIVHRLRGLFTNINRISAWVKLNVDPALANDDVWGVYGPRGEVYWRLVVALVSGNIVWQILDSTGAVACSYNTGAPRDESWTWVSVLPYNSGGSIAISFRNRTIPDRILAFNTITGLPSSALGVWLVVGGRMNPVSGLGKQTNTLQGSVSSFTVQYGTELPFSYSDRSAAGVTYTGTQRTTAIAFHTADIDTLVGGVVGTTDTDVTPIQLTNAASTALVAWNEHMITTGGLVLTRPDGRMQWKTPSTARPVAVALTLDVSQDIHLPAGGFGMQRDQRPTRVTASGPVGVVTVTNAGLEASTGQRLDGADLDTAAGTIDVARSAAAILIAQRASRFTGFGWDLQLTATDKIAAAMALLPGDRLQLASLPTAFLGVTAIDVHAMGWSETYGGDVGYAEWVFDPDPADNPVEGRFDTRDSTRFTMDTGSTITGGTCVGNTGTGTVIITSTSPLNATGVYPIVLDWNGEKLTVSGVGGATSPQTATVTARGVAPSVARIHASGETVSIWQGAVFTY
jgi:hypothetical protein